MSLILDKINYYYGKGTAFESAALKNISLSIPDGEFIGIIGHTGSGKSTLIQHMNGLLRADSGNIYYNSKDIYDKDTVEPHLKDYLYNSESLEALIRKKISRQQHEYEVAVKSERIEIPDP